jgi:hypothetical protein
VTSSIRWVAAALVLALLAAGVWAFSRTRDAGDDARGTSDGGPGRSELAVVSVRGAPHALVGVVGVHPNRPSAALVLPSDVTIVAPGQGETRIEGVAALAGDSMRIAVSNAIGAWARHYGVLDLDALAAAVDRAGGLPVDLPEPVTLEDQTLDVGEVDMSGDDVGAYLALAEGGSEARWTAVLDALLSTGPLTAADVVDSDDAQAFVELLGSASDATAEIAPTAPVAARATVLDQPAADELTRDLFGGHAPTPIVVQNGNGRPNVGEVVAARLLPAGFRVVVSQNAETFRHRRTEIAATDPEFADEAERVQELLSVGRVVVSQVPSGLADITIVVGRDFTA